MDKHLWTFIIFLLTTSRASCVYELRTDYVSHQDAATVCKLAAPEIKLTKEGYTVHLKDIEAEDNVKIWTGYSQIYHSFQYRGCNHLKEMQASKTYITSGEAGMCYSVCKTRYLGLGRKKDKRLCFCFEKQPMLDTEDECDETCNGILCGGNGYISVYEHLGESDEQQSNGKSCLVFYPFSETIVWETCSEYFRVMCEVQGTVDSRLTLRHTWSKTMELCFDIGQFPITRNNARHGDALTLGRWTGQVRSLATTDKSKNPNGYLLRHRENCILLFESAGEFGRPLCITDSESAPGSTTADHLESVSTFTDTIEIVTESRKGLSTDSESVSESIRVIVGNQESSSAFTYTSTFVTESKTSLSTDFTTHGDLQEQQEDRVPGLAAAYVAIPVLLLLLIALAVLFTVWKRKHPTTAGKTDSAGKGEVPVKKQTRIRTVANATYQSNVLEQSSVNIAQHDYYELEAPSITGHGEEALNDVLPAEVVSHDYHELEPMGKHDNFDEVVRGQTAEDEYDTTTAAHEIRRYGFKDTDTHNIYNKLAKEDDDTYNAISTMGHDTDINEEYYSHLDGQTAEDEYDTTEAANGIRRQCFKGTDTENIYNKPAKEENDTCDTTLRITT